MGLSFSVDGERVVTDLQERENDGEHDMFIWTGGKIMQLCGVSDRGRVYVQEKGIAKLSEEMSGLSKRHAAGRHTKLKGEVLVFAPSKPRVRASTQSAPQTAQKVDQQRAAVS